MKKLDVVKKRMNNKKLTKYACKDQDAILLKNETEDIRSRFFRDIDRIIYSLSYTRYIDKTQVFSFSSNDNISKRITHVEYVSKIARTIGRSLGLNEDLIEAASIGHDLGHPPFGHVGESILNKISIEYNEGLFAHNVQSARVLMTLENNGKGRNISVQTLDAILCHNGELVNDKYYPIEKSKEDFLKEYSDCYKDSDTLKKLRPMTIEGCVVRISDIIGYIGKDIEDAIRLNIIKKDDIDSDITSVLGYTNREIINTIITDIINNSYNKPYIKLSKEVYNAVIKLKEFNYKNIYNKINTDEDKKMYEEMYMKLFKTYMKALDKEDKANDIYTIFLHNMDNSYMNKTSNARKVIDYISSMTDSYFINRYNMISQIKIKR